MKGETWSIILIIVAAIIFTMLVVALVRINKKKKEVRQKSHGKVDATDSSHVALPQKEKDEDSQNKKTEKTLEQLGIQAKMIGFEAVIRTGLFGGNEELRLKRDGITLDVRIDSNGEATIKPVIPIWFQLVCVFVVMIVLSIVLSLMADQTMLVKGGVLVVLAGLLIASPIYKSIKRKAFDAAIESVTNLL